MIQRLLSSALYSVAALIGVFALAYPFISGVPSPTQGPDTLVGGQGAYLLTAFLVSLCLAVLLVDFQGQVASSKTIATLGIMVSATAVLRFIEVAIPGPAGFSPVFAPIILCGYVFGSRFGFLMGALVMLTSAVITGGVGPWLPYQMFTAGWVGLTAGWLPHPQHQKVEMGFLSLFGFMWGFAYGLIMNLYSWPFLVGDPQLTWLPGDGPQVAIQRYAAYYMVTSFVWDSAAAIGNVLLLSVLGIPAVKALDRFRDRMQFRVLPG